MIHDWAKIVGYAVIVFSIVGFFHGWPSFITIHKHYHGKDDE